MKLSIGIAAYGSLETTKACWMALCASTDRKADVELVCLNNGADPATSHFLKNFIAPFWMDFQLLETPENIGAIPSMNLLIERSQGEVICLFHNDLYVLEEHWNHRVTDAFTDHPEVGLAGFFGAKGIGSNGGRDECYSNMLDAEHHSTRCGSRRFVTVFDGLSLIGRRKMFEQVGGFDETYALHHFYDRDISMASIEAGWKNLYIGVRCFHMSGQTACHPQYGEWIAKKLGVPVGTGDQESYNRSERRFFQKWGSKIPTKVP